MLAEALNPNGATDRSVLQILLVEDDDDHAELAGEALGRAECPIRVERVATIAHALDRIKDRNYDALVVDYNLPDGAGLILVDELHARGVTIPSLLLTGGGSEEVAASALRSGVDDYLPKRDGLVGDLLTRTVLKMIEHRCMEDELGRSRSYADNLRGALLAGQTAQFHVNNCLTVTLGYAELILLDSLAPSRIHRMAGEIVQSCQEATRRLHALSSLQSLSIDSKLRGAELLDLS